MKIFSLKIFKGVGTFAFVGLFIQISDGHIPYEFFFVGGGGGGLIFPKRYKLGQQMVKETSCFALKITYL